MKTTKEITLHRLIYNLLTINIEARDNWMLTIKLVHQTEMTLQGIHLSDYFTTLYSEELSNINTIKRAWSKVQQIMPNLRGEKWEERQKQGGQYVSHIDSSQLKLFNEEELHQLVLISK